MKNLFKTFLLCTTSFITSFSCAQTTMRTLQDAKKLETNKQEFVGKSLNHLLKNINLTVKSVIPAPNKNKNEINRMTVLFIPYSEYRNDKRDISKKPTTITIVFNQNWDLTGEQCTYNKSGCTDWTKEDEKNLGNLIIYDIYVIGKD